ncbi:HYR domain-containing protein [Myxococcus xanthus]|uniref:HYR domain-containing protein n=1 Tax=Myxococcus xanthus TaxID=34 RepID=UPI003AB4BF49
MYLGAPRWRTSLDSTSIITGDSGLAIVLETSIPEGTPLRPGTHSVTVTARDPSGNSSSCTFSIVVVKPDGGGGSGGGGCQQSGTAGPLGLGLALAALMRRGAVTSGERSSRDGLRSGPALSGGGLFVLPVMWPPVYKRVAHGTHPGRGREETAVAARPLPGMDGRPPRRGDRWHESC